MTVINPALLSSKFDLVANFGAQYGGDITTALTNALTAAYAEAQVKTAGKVYVTAPPGYQFSWGQVPIFPGTGIYMPGVTLFANPTTWNGGQLKDVTGAVPAGGTFQGFDLIGPTLIGSGQESQSSNNFALFPGNQMACQDFTIKDVTVQGYATCPFQLYNPGGVIFDNVTLRNNEFGNNGFVNSINGFFDGSAPIPQGGFHVTNSRLFNSTADGIAMVGAGASLPGGVLFYTATKNKLFAVPPRIDSGCSTQGYSSTVISATGPLSATVPVNVTVTTPLGNNLTGGVISFAHTGSGSNVLVCTYTGTDGSGVFQGVLMVAAFKNFPNNFTLAAGDTVSNANTVLDPNIVSTDTAQYNPTSAPLGMVGKWVVGPKITSPQYMAYVYYNAGGGQFGPSSFTLIKSNNTLTGATGVISGTAIMNLGVFRNSINCELDNNSTIPYSVVQFEGNQVQCYERAGIGVNNASATQALTVVAIRNNMVINGQQNVATNFPTNTTNQGGGINVNSNTATTVDVDVSENKISLASPLAASEVNLSNNGMTNNGRQKGNSFSTGAKQGTATLVAGTVTVATTEVRTGDLIRIWRISPGTNTTNPLGNLTLGTVTAGTSFVVTAVSGTTPSTTVTTDVSLIGWEIIH